jgi:flagellin-like protein
MIKLWKSRKALSPVVAAIILIAVTVAVSIAVAAWMGALTFTFMKTEELKVIGVNTATWTTGNPGNATVTVKNTGTSALTISSVKVNDAAANDWGVVAPDDATLDPGEEVEIWVEHNYSSGTKYEFAFYTATGNRYPYTATAP